MLNWCCFEVDRWVDEWMDKQFRGGKGESNSKDSNQKLIATINLDNNYQTVGGKVNDVGRA